jgi:hypothetical protein
MKKWPRRLFRPKTNHSCHQKPNPSRETVPLMQNPIFCIEKHFGFSSATNKETAKFYQCLIVGQRAKVPLKQADEVR